MNTYHFIYSNGTVGNLVLKDDDEAIRQGINVCRLLDSSFVYVWKKTNNPRTYFFLGKFEYR